MYCWAGTPRIPRGNGQADDDGHKHGADVVGVRLDGRLSQLRGLYQRHDLRQRRVLPHPRRPDVQRPALLCSVAPPSEMTSLCVRVWIRIGPLFLAQPDFNQCPNVPFLQVARRETEHCASPTLPFGNDPEHVSINEIMSWQPPTGSRAFDACRAPG